MNNCHLWILKIYQVDIRNIHYPWYIDGIRKIYAKIYAIVYYVFCTVTNGSYSCSCNTGYVLSEHNCTGKSTLLLIHYNVERLYICEGFYLVISMIIYYVS